VLPLVLATMAAQSLLVVLAPTMVAAGREFGTSVGTVGHARAIAAASAVAASLVIARLIDRVGLRRLMAAGACLAVMASAAIAAATSLGAFLAAQCVSGIAFACPPGGSLRPGCGAFVVSRVPAVSSKPGEFASAPCGSSGHRARPA
jgi:predicted MFS family arabinose efflux permease